MALYRGLTPPSVIFRTFGAFYRTPIIKNVRNGKNQLREISDASCFFMYSMKGVTCSKYLR